MANIVSTSYACENESIHKSDFIWLYLKHLTTKKNMLHISVKLEFSQMIFIYMYCQGHFYNDVYCSKVSYL